MQELLPSFLPSWLMPLWAHLPFAAIFLALGSFAALGLFFLVGSFLAKQRKRTSYEKGARQLCLLGTGLGLLVLIATRAALFWYYDAWLPGTFFGLLLEIGWLMLCVTVLCMCLLLLVWKTLVKHSLPFSLLSTITLFEGLATVFLAFFFWYLARISIPESVDALFLTLKSFDTHFSVRQLPALLGFLPLILALPAVFGSLGLLALRSVHDFGRDHYTIVLSWLMRWTGRVGFLLFSLVALGLAIVLSPFHDALLADPSTVLLPFWPALLFLLCWFCGPLILLAFAASEVPLRHKVWMVVVDILLLLTVPLFLEMTLM